MGVSTQFSAAVFRPALSLHDDQSLARLVANGSEVAFEAIVTRYRGTLERRARRVVGWDRSEDVVQEAFVRLASYLESGSEIRELRHWLNRVVLNLAIDAIRSQRPDAPSRFPDEEPAGIDNQPHQILEQQGRFGLLLSGLSDLPDKERQAFMMRELEGMNAAQIARRLSTNPNNVYQLLHRARARLRESVHKGSDLHVESATVLVSRQAL